MKEDKLNVGVSIIVPTYQRFQFIKKLIESLIDSDVDKKNCELVLVSSDDSDCEKINWIKSITEIDIKLIIEEKRDNRRKKSLNYFENLGIKNSNKEWILVCNDDMWFDKNWYSNFLNRLTDSKVYLVATHIGTRNEGLRIPSLGTITKDGKVDQMWLYDMSIIHKSIYEKIDYLDEDVEWFGKGADLSLAISFLTDEVPVLCHDVIINHDLADELRYENKGSYSIDFGHIRNKWNKWIIDNNKNYGYNWI